MITKLTFQQGITWILQAINDNTCLVHEVNPGRSGHLHLLNMHVCFYDRWWETHRWWPRIWQRCMESLHEEINLVNVHVLNIFRLNEQKPLIIIILTWRSVLYGAFIFSMLHFILLTKFKTFLSIVWIATLSSKYRYLPGPTGLNM